MLTCKGFGLGLYDGISGLVTQPVKGAQQGGALGFMKGFGKGIGGAVCKPASGTKPVINFIVTRADNGSRI